MKLGARIIKTGIAIVLALYLAQLLELPAPVFAGIAAIFAIQPTIYRSYLSVMEQIQGNLVGAIIAVVFVLLFGNHIFIIGLAVVIVITINLKLNMEKSLILSIVTVIAIMESQQGDFLQFSMIRFSTILLGILSSFIVNLVFIPPKYETKLYNRINNVTEDIFKWIRISTRHASEHTLLKKDISRIKDTLLKLEQTYSMFKEERDYFKKESLSKSRKLVVYRQMITTTKKAYETLKRIHKFENEINLMPEDFQTQIQLQLDSLIHQHEQILLKYIGKIKIVSCIDEYNGQSLSRNEFLSFFFTQIKKMEHTSEEDEENVPTRLLPLISAIIEYDEQLEHLEKLINSFQSFHKDENEVSVKENIEDI
ncbi:aromatic acid exporter family protein [Bacillus sp. V59.32b]|uniref:FUSC family protein n=1 Tax=Bacillus sp. V59.32b TaxID=1758642 RepID=UPI000E3CDFAE|nr:aromatic acid exporter family protein [Bacillus sp. V59.32b]RFU69396.1 aromatic acid exporter family protein [Bacillus sp. V59.32b]